VLGPKRAIAWRILDAQYFGVAQRRRRLFVVGCPADGADPRTILFESEGVRRDTAPSREAEERIAPAVSTRAPFSCTRDERVEDDAMVPVVTARMAAFGEYVDDGTASTVKARDFKDATDLVLMDQGGSVMNVEHDIVGTLRRETHGHEPSVIHNMAVRRLTPTEAERLQGFPDGYTLIPWKKKPAEDCPDGPRYKALGNSFAVPVVRWLGERINAVENKPFSLFDA
jgi:DNA (cytosine-5)-methyltransferase 1